MILPILFICGSIASKLAICIGCKNEKQINHIGPDGFDSNRNYFPVAGGFGTGWQR